MFRMRSSEGHIRSTISVNADVNAATRHLSYFNINVLQRKSIIRTRSFTEVTFMKLSNKSPLYNLVQNTPKISNKISAKEPSLRNPHFN